MARENRTLRGNDLFKSLDRWIGIPLVTLAGLVTDRNSALPSDPREILVIKLSAIGDTICLMPALRALRRRYPSARITAVGTAINRAIYDACPFIDDVITIDIKKMARNPFLLLSLFRKKHFDIAIDFDQWTRLSPLLAFASDAMWRIGFITDGQARHYLYHATVAHRTDRHEIDCFIDLLAPLGIIQADEALTFTVPPAAVASAEQIMSKAGITDVPGFVVLHPETPAHGTQRQWPADRYIAVGKKLAAEGYQIIISGTAQDMESSTHIANAVGKYAHVLPPCSLLEFAGILKQARLMICGNTGVMHLAAAMDIPLIALHGPTNPAKWGPRSGRAVVIKSSRSCSPCLYLGFEYGCADNACMRDISSDQVSEAAIVLLKRFEKHR